MLRESPPSDQSRHDRRGTNVCVFIRSLLLGGAEKQSILLADYLARFCTVHLVVLFPSTDLLAQAQARGVNVTQLHGSWGTKICAFYSFLRRQRVDTLICFLPSNNIVGGIVGRLAGVPRIFGGIRGSKIKESKLKMFAQKIVCNYLSECFIANSQPARTNYIAYGYKASKVKVIPNMIDVGEMAVSKVSRQDGSPTPIISVGRLVEEKDYGTALRAMEIVNQRHDGRAFLYRIVGYGPLRDELLREIEARRLSHCVELLDGQVNGVVAQALNSADIFLLTSKFEGMPNAVMEAMLHALPVVATDTGDVRQLVVHGVTGYVCQIGNHQEIADRLLSLMSSRDLRDKMAEQGQRRISEEFSMERVGEMYRALLDSAFHNSPRQD